MGVNSRRSKRYGRDPTAVEAEGVLRLYCRRPMSYCARFHTTSSTEPICEAGLVYFSSVAESELMIRFWVPPFKFVDDAASMLVVRVFVASSIDHVPKFAVIPCIAALLSSAVTWFRLSEANFGTSDR